MFTSKYNAQKGREKWKSYNWRSKDPMDVPNDANEKEDLDKDEKEEKKYVDVLVVSELNGKLFILLNTICVNRIGFTSAFINQVNGHNVERAAKQCVLNMTGMKLEMMRVDEYLYYTIIKGHTEANIYKYSTIPRYQKKIGHLNYVPIDEVDKYICDRKSIMCPKAQKIIDFLKNNFLKNN